MIKTSGKEFKAFYNDQEYWQDGWFHDDTKISVDGEDDTDLDLGAIGDLSEVIINGGTVFKGDYAAANISFEKHFKDWRKAQKFEFVTVKIPKGKSESVLEFVKSLNS
jgi:hypothetical protein